MTIGAYLDGSFCVHLLPNQGSGCLGGGGWGFVEDLITAEFVNRWEPQGSPAGAHRDTAWECCGPDSWGTCCSPPRSRGLLW